MKTKSLFAILMTGLAFMACQEKESVEPLQDSQLIQIDPVITRATETNFENGDKIGLRVQQTGAETVFADNAELTYDGSKFEGTQIWYKEGPVQSELTAYYPFAAGAVLPTEFAVKADQTTGLTGSDLMIASKPDVEPTANAITMIFQHKLTQIVINLDNKMNVGIKGVAVNNTKLESTIDWASKAVAVKDVAEVTPIKACQIENNKKFAAIVIPQTVAVNVAVELASGKILSKSLTETTLQAGGQYTINVTVLMDDIKVNISGDIEAWQDMGEITEEPQAPVFEEFENHFVYYGETYRIVKMSNGQVWMAENLRYVPEGKTPSADPKVESGIWTPYKLQVEGVVVKGATALEDEASIKAHGYLYDYDTAFGVPVTKENYNTFEGTQGICPKGWHIPTRDDFLALCGASNKFGTETGSIILDSALWFDAALQGGSVQKANEQGWNFDFPGMMQRTNLSATGMFSSVAITEKNSAQTELYGKNAMSYYIASTARGITEKEGVLTNIQFAGMMSTFTKVNDGKLSIGYSNYKSGYALRCIKNN